MEPGDDDDEDAAAHDDEADGDDCERRRCGRRFAWDRDDDEDNENDDADDDDDDGDDDDDDKDDGDDDDEDDDAAHGTEVVDTSVSVHAGPGYDKYARQGVRSNTPHPSVEKAAYLFTVLRVVGVPLHVVGSGKISIN